MEATIFREYQNSDFEELAQMIIGLYTKDGTRESHMTAAKVALSIEKLTATNSSGQVFIFEKNGECAGYAIVNRFWSNEFSGYISYIDELFVKQSHRGLKLGAAFFSYLEEKPENDSVAFMLETVPDNEKAIGFYKKVGFNTHHNYLMFKDLAKK